MREIKTMTKEQKEELVDIWKDIIKTDDVERLFEQREAEAWNSKNEKAIQFYRRLEKKLDYYLKHNEPSVKEMLYRVLQKPYTPDLDKELEI